jgi:hypothetical protein
MNYGKIVIICVTVLTYGAMKFLTPLVKADVERESEQIRLREVLELRSAIERLPDKMDTPSIELRREKL